ncbi:MAG TPA: TetR/AcrR family transcriptional regulator [Candidatus Scybalocola faecipullorum]|nr:TetR/AcrR family transcriptional regulator [Candidatus Scybalocola faecipullorum]
MDNKEKILESALDLFYSKGYDAVGVQEIVERSGITKPTLYHYFGSKYGLLEHLVRNYYGKFEEKLEAASVYDGDLPLTLYRFVNTYFSEVLKNKKFYCLFMSMMYAGKESDMYRVVRPYALRQLKMASDLFCRAGDIIGNMNGRHEQYAVTFIGVLNHYLLWWMSQEGKAKEFISGERAFAVVHQFLYGIYV